MWGRIQGDRRFLLLLLAVFVAAWLAPRGARAAEAAPSELTVTGTVRDFRYCEAPGVPAGCSRDFELAGGGLDPGLVEPVLGPDGLPIYDGAVPHPTVASRESFDQWFRDVPGVNSSTELPVTLLRDPMTGLYTFMSYRFFPIDSRLLGNQGLAHNYHFTYQVRTRFTYNGGEQFMYRSNGDLWIFMNGQLVVDLGGIHGTLDAVLNMDEVASRLELVQGQSYDLDLFYAQRRAPGSVLMFQTSLYMAPQPEVTAAGGAFPEGSPARLAVTIGGDGGAPHTAAVDWGDGLSTPPAPAPDMFDLFHTYADDGAYLATVTAAYAALEPGEGYAEFLIYNVAPNVAATARPGAQPGSILLRATFTDPGLWDNPWRFRVDWGDGTQMLSWAADPSLMPQSMYHIYAAPGTYTVNVRVWDKDGDFGDTSLQWLADMTPPQISHTITPVPGAAGWHRSPVTVAFACTDDGVGVQTCPEPQVVAAEGADMAVTGTAVDRAGNRAVDTARVSIDLTPPVLKALAPAGWQRSDVTVGWACSDMLSGVDACTAPVTVTAEGRDQAVAGTAVDRAGNRAEATALVSIDRTAPVITAAAPAGWQRSDVTVAFTCSDALSGVAGCSAPVTVTAEGRDQAVAGTAVDRAGNRAEATALVSIDKTAPVITAAAPTGWQRSEVTVAFTCSDGLSGVAVCPAPVTVSAEGRDQAVTGTAVDQAENRAGATAQVSIDKTVPAIAFAGNTGLYEVDATIAITCAATDGLSGLATADCPGFSGPAWAYTPGDITLTARATDLAGNTGQATATFTILVTFDGLCRLTEQFGDSGGVNGALCSKLRTAKESAMSGDITTQNAALDRYMRDVQVHSGKNFTPFEADTLIRLAANLRR